jgi:hypothetical protein
MDRVLIGLILGDQAFVVIVLIDHFVEIRMQKADQKDKIKRTLAPKLTDGQLLVRRFAGFSGHHTVSDTDIAPKQRVTIAIMR